MRKYSPEQLEENLKMLEMRKSGKTLESIAKIYDVTPEAISYRLNRTTANIFNEIKCGLFECQNKVIVTSVKRKYCSKKCSRVAISRNANGTNVSYQECPAPECKKIFLKIGNHRIFCSNKCCDLFSNRIKKGQYERLFDDSKKCFVCDEKLVLDIHHVEYTSKGSDKNSKTIYLCPTHHMYIHRGFAKIVNDKFVLIAEELKENLIRKHPDLVKKIRESLVHAV